LSNVCNTATGVCECRDNFAGDHCNECAEGYVNFPTCCAAEESSTDANSSESADADTKACQMVNIDMPGSDFKNTKTDTWTECGTSCQHTDGCKAFTWLDSTFSDESRRNTCYLKSKVVPTNDLKGVISGVKGCGCESCYGADTEDNKCCNTCADVEEAYDTKGWHFDESLIKQCESSSLSTKSKFPSFGASAFSVAKKVFNATKDAAKCQMVDTDIFGHDFKTHLTDTWKECGIICQQTDECKAFSWIDKTFSDASIHNYCNLKNKDGPTTTLTGVVTGLKGCPKPEPNCQMDDKDIFGHDLKSMETDTWEECGNLCQQTDECKAFSWISKTFSDPSIHNRCHLKTQDGPITAMTGVVTALKGCPVPSTTKEECFTWNGKRWKGIAAKKPAHTECGLQQCLPCDASGNDGIFAKIKAKATGLLLPKGAKGAIPAGGVFVGGVTPSIAPKGPKGIWGTLG